VRDRESEGERGRERGRERGEMRKLRKFRVEGEKRKEREYE